jgi:transposase
VAIHSIGCRNEHFWCSRHWEIRAKIVLLAATGLSNDDIGARLDTPRQIVSKWRQRFHRHRLAGLDEEPARRASSPLFPPASSWR